MSTKHRSTLPYGSNPMKSTKKEKGSFRKKIEARAAARAQEAKPAVAPAGLQVEVLACGRGEDTTRLDVNVGPRGEWSRELAARTFRIAARVSEESLGWGWTVAVEASTVVVELASGTPEEVRYARAAIERALGSTGRPNPSAPNMSTIYTVEA